MKKKFVKLSLGIAIIAFSLSSCSKKSEDTTPSVTPTPTSFTQKSLIEEFTGEWCGFCPDGALMIDKLIAANPGKVSAIAIHDQDPMALSVDQAYYQPTFKVTGFPTGMIDRKPDMGAGTVVTINRGNWGKNVTANLAQTAQCGLSIDATGVSGTSVTAKVKVAFAQDMTGPLYLTVVITEDDVLGAGQHNYYSSAGNNAANPSDPILKTLPPTITDWKHQNVLRLISSAGIEGELLDASLTKKGGVIEIPYTFTLTSAMKQANCSVLAFVHYKGTVTTSKELFNVQEVRVGSTQKFD